MRFAGRRAVVTGGLSGIGEAVAKRIEFGARTDSLPKPTLAVLMLENEFRRAKAALHALDH